MAKQKSAIFDFFLKTADFCATLCILISPLREGTYITLYLA